MRPMGFSTGAISLGDFRFALDKMAEVPNVEVVELSALRMHELKPLILALDSLNLDRYSYVSFHAPSKFSPAEEKEVLDLLQPVVEREWPIVVHPNSIYNWDLWEPLDDLLCLENMCRRKPVGRRAEDLEECFKKVPGARLCLDIGHSRQLDHSMNETFRFFTELGDRLSHLHISRVEDDSNHYRLDFDCLVAFRMVSLLIPQDTPIVLETPVNPEDIEFELTRARACLPIGS